MPLHSSEVTVGTKVQLIALIDDIDLITRQLFETLSQQSLQQQIKTEGHSSVDQKHRMNVDQLTDLLLQKNKELDGKMNTARNQQQLHCEIKLTKAKIEAKDKELQCLQSHLKEAEVLLSSSLYQAKEKLKSLKAAQAVSVPSEDIIRYAHKISAACATSAPLNWVPGDPRRPYPQDIEMRCGWLGQLNNLADANIPVKPPAQLGTEGLSVPDLKSTGLSAQLSSQLPNWSLHPDLEGRGRKEDDVEVMSTDSSTSSSSDSSFVND